MSESGQSSVADDRLFTGDVAGGHPIIGYPPQILGRIFLFWRDQWSLNLFSGIKGGHFHHGMPAPFILASVNRQFRDVAMATPSLWSLLYVDFAKGNQDIGERLRHMLWLAQETPLTLCFQGVTFDAYSTSWFREMHAVLSPTNQRWLKVIASFAKPNDLSACWRVWPLVGPNIVDMRIWESVPDGPSGQPTSFLAGCQALERVELRNIAWIHQDNTIFPTVKTLRIGPSADQAVGHTSVMHLCQSFPSLKTLRLLTLDDSTLVPHAPPLPPSFHLGHLTHLTVSPILLRTSLQGFQNRRVLPALMSVSVHFCPNEEEMDEDEEHLESARRNEDLETLGRFLQYHIIEKLKLHGLDQGYSPSALCTSVFRTMTTARLYHLCLSNCSDNTTQHIGVALTKVSLARETSRAARLGRVPRILQLHRGVGDEGAIYLLPSLRSLHVVRCSDVDGPYVLDYVRAAPRGLKEVLIRESDIDDGSYAEIKTFLM